MTTHQNNHEYMSTGDGFDGVKNTMWHRTKRLTCSDADLNMYINRYNRHEISTQEMLKFMCQYHSLSREQLTYIKKCDPRLSAKYQKIIRPLKNIEQANSYLCYENHTQEARLISKQIATLMLEWTLQIDLQVFLYGTVAFNMFANESNAPYKFKKVPESYDIDMATQSPNKVVNYLFEKLIDFARINEFKTSDPNICITIDKITLAEKQNNSYSIIAVMRCCEIPETHFLFRTAVLDCTPYQSGGYATDALPICWKNRNLLWQHPMSYLVGMVDKLFNSQINPAIQIDNRRKSEQKMIERFKDLEIYNLRDPFWAYPKQLIPHFTAVNDIPEAKQFLNGLVMGESIDSLMQIYEKWKTKLI